MIERGAAALLLIAVASCPPRAETIAVPPAPDLETAAIARGLVRDPRGVDIVGLYVRETDRLCIVRDGAGHRIGATVDYGEGIACNGAGRLTRSGGALRVSLGAGCDFDARFDGDRIAFPARLPDGCAALCKRRATLAAVSVSRLSDSAAEAATMRDTRGRLPCATG